MSMEFKHLPAILLIDGCHKGILPAREWLEQSRFRTWEALNVFEALEGISDFTLRNRPDVILVNANSITDDLKLLSDLLLQGSTNELEYPILALSAEGAGQSDNIFEGTFAEIKEQLEALVPMVSHQPPKVYIKSV